jgi:hypothetical protein
MIELRRNVFQPCDGGRRLFAMYFATVVCPTSMPQRARGRRKKKERSGLQSAACASGVQIVTGPLAVPKSGSVEHDHAVFLRG